MTPQILETGTDLMRSERSSERGFTLVEVLLVVFIVGLSTGLVIMALPSQPARLERAGVQVETTLHALQQRAVVTGIVHGIEIHEDRFEVVRRVDGTWVPDRTLGVDVAPPVFFQVQRRRGETGPHFFFDPAGVPVDHELVLVDGTRRRAVRLADATRQELR